jgi:hypothetical protein
VITRYKWLAKREEEEENKKKKEEEEKEEEEEWRGIKFARRMQQTITRAAAQEDPHMLVCTPQYRLSQYRL